MPEAGSCFLLPPPAWGHHPRRRRRPQAQQPADASARNNDEVLRRPRPLPRRCCHEQQRQAPRLAPQGAAQPTNGQRQAGRHAHRAETQKMRLRRTCCCCCTPRAAACYLLFETVVRTTVMKVRAERICTVHAFVGRSEARRAAAPNKPKCDAKCLVARCSRECWQRVARRTGGCWAADGRQRGCDGGAPPARPQLAAAERLRGANESPRAPGAARSTTVRWT